MQRRKVFLLSNHQIAKKNDGVTFSVPPSFFLYFDDLIRRAVQNPAQPTERDHGDVPPLFQRVQRSVVNAALEKLILRHALLHHCFP